MNVNNLQPPLKSEKFYSLYAEKDCQHNFTSCNADLLECCGLNSFQDLLGLSDFDLPWSEFAEEFVAHEREALAGNVYSQLIPVKLYTGEQKLFMHTKTPKYDTCNKIVGLYCHAIEVINPTVIDTENMLANTAALGAAAKLNFTNLTDKLTAREEQCLFYLAHGQSTKAIATRLSIAAKTVENHIESVKRKFTCYSKAELIEKTIDLGYMQIIPSCETLQALVDALQEPIAEDKS